MGGFLRKGAVLVIGDLNARIHARLRGEEPQLGPHIYGGGVDKLNNRGEGASHAREAEDVVTNRDLLLEMCSAHSLKVMNTWFQTPDNKKVTFMAPGTAKLPKAGESWDPEIFGELDLCLAPDRWSGMVKNVESNTRAGLNSDHFPLEVELELRLKMVDREEEQWRRQRYEFKGLGQDTKEAINR